MASGDECNGSQSASFLQAEFCERSQNRRHYESQIEHILSLYLTVLPIFISGPLVFWQVGRNPGLLLPLIAGAAIVLAVCGVFLAGRAMSADLRQAEELRRLNKVRRYFADRDPKIAAYLSRPVADVPTRLSRDLHFMLVKVLHVWNSLLLGTGLALPIRQFAGIPLLWTAAILLGVGVASYIGIFFLFRYWRGVLLDMIETEQSCS